MITFRSDAVARISARTYRNDVGIVCLGGVESRRIAFNSNRSQSFTTLQNDEQHQHPNGRGWVAETAYVAD